MITRSPPHHTHSFTKTTTCFSYSVAFTPTVATTSSPNKMAHKAGTDSTVAPWQVQEHFIRGVGSCDCQRANPALLHNWKVKICNILACYAILRSGKPVAETHVCMLYLRVVYMCCIHVHVCAVAREMEMEMYIHLLQAPCNGVLP